MIRPALALGALAILTGCTDIPLSGSAFEATTLGNTYYVQRGENPPYGIMQFGPDRQVMWQNFNRDNACFAGTWREPEPGLICFSYANPDRTICWENVQVGNQITVYLNGDRSEPYYYGQTTAAASTCPAPGAG